MLLLLLLACEPSPTGAQPDSSAATDVSTSETPTHTTTPSTSTTAATTTGPVDTGVLADTGPVGTTEPPPPLPCGAPRVRLNEISPANGEVIVDSDGDTPDWIELYNGTFEPVDLTGWHLSDDDDDPTRWRFPPTVIDPGETMLVFASGKGAPSDVASWETVIDEGHLWSYLEVVAPPPLDWIRPGFDDGDWPVGPSGFGRGDGDDATVLDAHTIYVRTAFDLSAEQTEALNAAWLHVDHDDGFVAYLDGEEIVRDGVSGVPPAWDAWVDDGGQEAQLYQGRVPPAYDLAGLLSRLTPGPHVLAVEVHDAGPDSSDLSLIPFLTLGYDRVLPGSPSPALGFDSRADALHTDFSIALAGEPVLLTDPDGCVVDRVVPHGLRQDESWGRKPDGGAPGVFLEPTPGAGNTTDWRVGFTPTPTLWPDPGFYPNGTAIEASVWDPLATVHITTDGRVPTEDDPQWMPGLGTSSGPTVVRARAYATDRWPSRVATGTWFVRDAPEVAMVAVTVPPEDFDGPDGLYTRFMEDIEAEAHVAVFESDGAVVDQDIGLKIHGAASRNWAQKSLRLLARSAYGTTAIEHPLFPDTDLERHERLVLRNAGHDWMGCTDGLCQTGAHMRDAVAHRLVAGIDIDRMGSRPTLVTVNGVPWGHYNLRERLDEEWIANRHGVTDVDILEWEFSVVRGDNDHWISFMATLRSLDRASPEAWDHVQDHLDVAEVAAYHATQILIANVDWPGNNRKWWRPRTPDGRYRFLLYDTDFGLGRQGYPVDHDTLAFATAEDGGGANAPWATELLRLLLEVPAFHDLYVNTTADLLNTHFHPLTSTAVVDAMAAERTAALPEHLDRFATSEGGARRIADETWHERVATLRDWVADRPAYVWDDLLANLDLDGTFPLELRTEPPGAGRFRLAVVTVEDGFVGDYVLGVPVRVEAIPEPGWSFVGWDDPRLDDTPLAVLLGDPAGHTLTARFE